MAACPGSATWPAAAAAEAARAGQVTGTVTPASHGRLPRHFRPPARAPAPGRGLPAGQSAVGDGGRRCSVSLGLVTAAGRTVTVPGQRRRLGRSLRPLYRAAAAAAA